MTDREKTIAILTNCVMSLYGAVRYIKIILGDDLSKFVNLPTEAVTIKFLEKHADEANTLIKELYEIELTPDLTYEQLLTISEILGNLDWGAFYEEEYEELQPAIQAILDKKVPEQTVTSWYHELVNWLRLTHPKVYKDYLERVMAVHEQGMEKRK